MNANDPNKSLLFSRTIPIIILTWLHTLLTRLMLATEEDPCPFPIKDITMVMFTVMEDTNRINTTSQRFRNVLTPISTTTTSHFASRMITTQRTVDTF